MVSVARGVRERPGRLAGLIREFPRVPAVALLSGAGNGSAEAVLALGNCGVRRIVDVRDPTGWHQLRTLLGRESTREADRAILALIRADLDDVTRGCWAFFEAIFASERVMISVKQLASTLGVVPSTLMSRFFRAKLPAPKRYLSFARLIRAARLLENPGLSVADTANQLDYSSPQSFGRHVQIFIGVTAGRFRHEYSEASMVARFREELVLPHRLTLQTMKLLGASTTASCPSRRASVARLRVFRG